MQFIAWDKSLELSSLLICSTKLSERDANVVNKTNPSRYKEQRPKISKTRGDVAFTGYSNLSRATHTRRATSYGYYISCASVHYNSDIVYRIIVLGRAGPGAWTSLPGENGLCHN